MERCGAWDLLGQIWNTLTFTWNPDIRHVRLQWGEKMTMTNRVVLFCFLLSLFGWAQNAPIGEDSQHAQLTHAVKQLRIRCSQSHQSSTALSRPFRLKSVLLLDPSFSPAASDCQPWQYKENGTCKDRPGTVHCRGNQSCPPGPGYTCWDECLCRDYESPGPSSCAPCSFEGTVCTPS